MDLSCTVSEIRRLIGKKLPIFPTPSSHSAPSLPMFPLEFRVKLTVRKLESSYSEDRMSCAAIFVTAVKISVGLLCNFSI